MEKNKFNWGLFSFAAVGIAYNFFYYDMRKSVGVLLNTEKYMCLTIGGICLTIILLICGNYLCHGKLLNKIKLDFDFLAYYLVVFPFCIFYLLIEKEKGILSNLKIVLVAVVILCFIVCLINNIIKIKKRNNN